jgi:plasmid stability protein
MATIVIRKLDETVKRKLQVRAAQNGRSMEAEAREMLSGLVTEGAPARRQGLGTALRKRFAAIGGVDLPIPPRRFSPSSDDAPEIPNLDRGLGTAIHELFAPLGGVELPIPPRRKSHRPIPDFS